MYGFKGDTLDDALLKVYAEHRIKKLRKLSVKLDAYAIPEAKDVNPMAYAWEVDFAIKAFKTLLTDRKKAVKMLLALPIAVGSVNLYDGAAVVHMGWGYTHYEEQIGDEQIVLPVYLARPEGSKNTWAWVDVRVLSEDMSEDEENPLTWVRNQGYELKNENVAIVTCPGWTELNYKLDDPDDYRTFKDVKLGKHYKCGHEFAANEPWHKMRCKECTEELKKFRGVGGRTGSGSKAKIERDLNKALLAIRKNRK